MNDEQARSGLALAQPTTDNRRSPFSILHSPFFILSLLGCGSALLYTLPRLRFPLQVLYTCPRTNLDKLTRIEATPHGLPLASYICPTQNLDNLTRPDVPTGLALLLGVLLLFGAYALGALALWGPPQNKEQRTKNNEIDVEDATRIRQPLSHELPFSILNSQFFILVLIGFPLLFVALLLRVYPATSVDLYDYLFRGRMIARYAANTFVQVPQDFSADPLFDFVAWRRAVTAYGPLWEGLSWLTARLSGETHTPAVAAARNADLLRLLLAFKALDVLGFLLCGAAIWGALGRIAPERRRLGLYLWLWNPLALWESAGAGHNDAWMALFIVLAVWAFAGGEPGTTQRVPDREPLRVRGPWSVVSRRRWTTDYEPRTTDHRRLFAASIVAFLGLTAGGLVKFLPLFLGPVLLGAGLRRLPSWRARVWLVLLGGLACLAAVALAYAPFWAGWATFRNFGDRGRLFTATWLAALQAELTARGVDKTLAQEIAATLGLWLLLGGAAWAGWRAWRAPERVAAHALGLLLWFLFVCNLWFQPWYLVWPLALVALQPWRARMLAAIGLLCCTAMLGCYVAWTFLRPQLGWGVESAAWNALLCVMIYGPPLLVLGLGRDMRPDSRAEPVTNIAHLEQRLEIGD